MFIGRWFDRVGLKVVDVKGGGGGGKLKKLKVKSFIMEFEEVIFFGLIN